jgi:hypothetical protein
MSARLGGVTQFMAWGMTGAGWPDPSKSALLREAVKQTAAATKSQVLNPVGKSCGELCLEYNIMSEFKKDYIGYNPGGSYRQCFYPLLYSQCIHNVINTCLN